jgi:hypothetical protein
MVAILGLLLGSVALAAGIWLAVKSRREHRTARDPLERVFRSREFAELDRHLERIAVDERRRLEVSALRYLRGDVGYVVRVVTSRHGIGLRLSDGHRLELGGVGRSALPLLERSAAEGRLRPEDVTRDGFSYRLHLRAEAGGELEIFAHRVTLAL